MRLKLSMKMLRTAVLPFVTGAFSGFQVSGYPTREETEELTSLWQTGLWNSHIQADRFLLEDDRAIFMFKVKKIEYR